MATATTMTQFAEKGGEKRVEDSQQVEYFDEKREAGSLTDSDVREETKPKKDRLKSARDLVTEVLLVEDDPTVNPWTFRMWFIGLGLSVFGGYVGLDVEPSNGTGLSQQSTHSSRNQYTSISCS
jgi:hypothetical protein